jgi:hypothetical protein
MAARPTAASDGGRRGRPNADAWKRTGIIAGGLFVFFAIGSLANYGVPAFAD